MVKINKCDFKTFILDQICSTNFSSSLFLKSKMPLSNSY